MAEAPDVTARISCSNIHKRFAAVEVLKGVSLEVANGETVAILGNSGCGKSTLLRCLALLEQPEQGSAQLEGQTYLETGKPIYAPWQLRTQVSLVFQDFNLFPNLTALQNITLGLILVKQRPFEEARSSAIAMADRLGVRAILEQYPETLSGGQAQRVALARSMVMQPSVLLLDEVTSALDPESVRSVVDAIRHIRSLDERGGLGIVLVTHHLRFAREFADTIAFLHEGEIVDKLPARQFEAKCTNPAAQSFVTQYSTEF